MRLKQNIIVTLDDYLLSWYLRICFSKKKKKLYKYNLGLKKSLVNTKQLFAIMWRRWQWAVVALAVEELVEVLVVKELAVAAVVAAVAIAVVVAVAVEELVLAAVVVAVVAVVAIVGDCDGCLL